MPNVSVEGAGTVAAFNISVNSAAAAAVAQTGLNYLNNNINNHVDSQVVYAGQTTPTASVPTIEYISGATAAFTVMGNNFDAFLSNTTGLVSIVDYGSTNKQTIVGGQGGLNLNQNATSVSGSLIVSGGGSSTINLAAGANTVSLDISPKSTTVQGGVQQGSGIVEAAGGGALIFVNPALNDATHVDMAYLYLGKSDTVQVNGAAFASLSDTTEAITVGGGGEGIFENTSPQQGQTNISLGAGNETVGVATGSTEDFTGANSSIAGTIDVLNGSGLQGSAVITANSENVLDVGGNNATTLFGGAGSDTIGGIYGGGSSGLIKAGSGGNSQLTSAQNISGAATSLVAGGANDSLFVQSGDVSLSGGSVTGSVFMYASGFTIYGGNVSIGNMSAGSTTTPGVYSVAGAGFGGNVTLNAGAANALIYAQGADAIISGSGNSTAYGHSGYSNGSGDAYYDGAPNGKLTIEDFRSQDIFYLEPGQSVVSISTDGASTVAGAPPAGSTTALLNNGTQIIFANGFVTPSNESTYFVGDPNPCFVSGTRILNADGKEQPVETLQSGDMVKLHDGTTAPIKWLGYRKVDLHRHPRPETVRPIVIKAGALGERLPRRNLAVSPDHALYLDGHLIPAKALINGFTIRQLTARTVSYFHIELPAHGILVAEGVAAESYLDTGNRGAFENGGTAVLLHPDFAQTWRRAESCAALVEAGPVVERVRQMILDRAGIETSDDPMLRIAWRRGAVVIESRTAVPGEMTADPRDRRRLGVKIGRLAIDGRNIPLDHWALVIGWHDVEADGRWTDGRAIIPARLCKGAKDIQVTLAGALRYPAAAGRGRVAVSV